MSFQILHKRVSAGAPCYIVGEVGQAHDGSYALAHAYIDAIADAGADAVKFQCHIAVAESTPDEAWRVEPKWKQDASRYSYWHRMEFTPPQWRELRNHAHGRALGFIVSPFSVEAVAMLSPLVDAWKVASGEVTHTELLDALWTDGRPVILSSGMSTEGETAAALHVLSGWVPTIVLDCVSVYPCQPELMGPPVWDGLSDHSGTIWPAIAYVSRGTCQMLEVHVTLARGTGLLDESSSITVQELAQLVRGVRFVERMGIASQEEREERLKPMRELFMDRWKRKQEEACQTAVGTTE